MRISSQSILRFLLSALVGGLLAITALYWRAVADRNLLVLAIGSSPYPRSDGGNQTSYTRAFYKFLNESRISETGDILVPAGQIGDDVMMAAKAEVAEELAKLKSLSSEDKARAFSILQDGAKKFLIRTGDSP